MRVASDDLKGVLTGGGFGTRLLVDAFLGANRSVEGLEAESWDLKWDSEAKIKSGGTLTVAETSDAGESLVPKSFTDPLAVAGQEVSLALEVFTDGGFSERIQLGHYRVTAVPASVETVADVRGKATVMSSRVTLTLEDRLITVERKGFRSEQNPPSGATCWGELQRLSGLQVVRNVPDRPVPSGTVYLAQQGGVLKAVEEIADALGGVPYLTPAGALSVLPDARGPVAASLVLGEQGTILDLTDTMESEGIYNEVVGNFQDADRNPFYCVATQTTGPFRASGPYGTYTRYYASDFVKTKSAGDAAVKAILTQAQQGQSYRVPVQCIVNPLIEDGDTVSVQRRIGAPVVGRVISHSMGSSNLMNLELDVVRELV